DNLLKHFEVRNHSDAAGKAISRQLVSLRLGIIHVDTVGLGGCRADLDSNCIPSVYQNCGSVPTALPGWRNSVDNPLLSRTVFDREDPRPFTRAVVYPGSTASACFPCCSRSARGQPARIDPARIVGA